MKNQTITFDFNKKSGQSKKKKLNLVFNEEKRREFLSGFRKRKLQRKQKAQEELQKQLKEERKRIKQNAKEEQKKLLSSRRIPEVDEFLEKTDYDLEEHTVSILELNMTDLAKDNAYIGENKAAVSDDEDEEKHDEEECDEESDEENVPGMSLTEEKKIKGKTLKENKNFEPQKEYSSKHDFKKAVKRAAMKQVQKSKAFQTKQKLERNKNKKESMRKQKVREKLLKKKGKVKKSKRKNLF